jgi:hypothetical protein
VKSYARPLRLRPTVASFSGSPSDPDALRRSAAGRRGRYPTCPNLCPNADPKENQQKPT